MGTKKRPNMIKGLTPDQLLEAHEAKKDVKFARLCQKICNSREGVCPSELYKVTQATIWIYERLRQTSGGHVAEGFGKSNCWKAVSTSLSPLEEL